MKIKLTNENKFEKLTDWKESDINRGNELYFIPSEINISELQNLAFSLNILINIENVGFVSKLTFVDILN